MNSIPDPPLLSPSPEVQSFTESAQTVTWIERWLVTFFQLTVMALIVGIAFSNLVHPSPWQRSIGFWHSFFATGATAIFLYAGTFSIPVLRGTVSIDRVQRSTFAAAIAAILSLFSGFRAFSRYKAPVDDAAGTYIQVVSPLMQAGMTWHFLISFSLFGLAISSFYCFWLYGERLRDPRSPYRQIRAALSLCLGWIALIGLTTFAIGIAIAKIHSL